MLASFAGRIYVHSRIGPPFTSTNHQPLLDDMPTLHEKESGQVIGRISESDIQFLIDQLEEESSDDRDYYIDEATVDMLEEDGAS